MGDESVPPVRLTGGQKSHFGSTDSGSFRSCCCSLVRARVLERFHLEEEGPPLLPPLLRRPFFVAEDVGGPPNCAGPSPSQCMERAPPERPHQLPASPSRAASCLQQQGVSTMQRLYDVAAALRHWMDSRQYRTRILVGRAAQELRHAQK